MHDTMRLMDDVSRRHFVAGAAAAFLGVSFVPGLEKVMGAPAADIPANPPGGGKAKRCIYIFLTGGLSHIDTFDPKPGTSEQGPTKVIPTNVPGIALTEYLPGLAKQMDKIALIRSMTTKVGAHERGQYFMRTSYQPIATIRHPAMGAWVMKLGPATHLTLPGNVIVNPDSGHPGAGFLDSRFAPLAIGDPDAGLQNSHLPAGVTQSRFENRLSLTNQFDQSFRARYPQKDVQAYTDFYQDAVKLMSSKDLEAFDLDKESKSTRDAYGDNKFGQGCLLARRLAQRGVRFIEIDNGGWDTHQDNFDRLGDKMPEIDQGLSALLADLAAQGMLEDTLVAVCSEFGRTPKINERTGRDHHPRVFTTLLAGGGVKGGQVHGKSDDKAFAVADQPVEIPDFNATIAWALGLPISVQTKSASGRPFTVAAKGQPVTSLFA
ncbi:MAG: DUF1501 domain-containing protein [Planctomycetes bacterium]|nr:DUF1501 domain-containing protein [Planctomycetota bacterium]